jgi:DNA-binding NarL/FixJ family response regulator
MKILLVDDHALFREGIAHVLRRLADAVEVLEAADEPTAIRLASENADLALVLLDLKLLVGSGLAALHAIRRERPDAPIVILTASEDDADIRSALQAGARGYITKASTSQVMLPALQLVLSGGVYLPPSMLHAVGVEIPARPATLPAAELMTPRQLDVLGLLATGMSNKDIARRLSMAQGTVRTHVTAIFKTLHVVNRTQAVNEARRQGLVPG